MTLRTAVVGAGVVSGRHLEGLKRNPLADLVAICDIDEDLVSDRAKEYGIKAYVDMGEMIEEESLDWVHICTPVQTHRELALQAIEAGIDVQIEKPATLTVEELQEIRSAAEERGVSVTVVRNHLFQIATLEAKERIESGELGRIRGVDVIAAGKTEPDDENRGEWAFDLEGGEFEEGIPHQIYLALDLGGYPRDEESVHATTALAGRYDREFGYDGVQLQWATADEQLCSVKLLAGGVPQRLLLVQGEEKSLAVDLLAQTVVELDRDYGASAVERALSNVDHVLGRVEGTVDNATGMIQRKLSSGWEAEKEWNPHFYQFHEEAESLLAGEDPRVSLDEVEWTVRLMELVRESAAREKRANEGDTEAVSARDEAEMATDDTETGADTGTEPSSEQTGTAVEDD